MEGGSSSLLSLDAEALDLVLRRLSAEDVGRVGATCKHLARCTKSGHHAAHLWRAHCQDLLGGMLVTYVAASGQAAQASTWHRLYSSSRTMESAHWSAGAAGLKRLASGSSSQTGSSGDSQLARYGHTATAVGSLLVLVGGMLRDGPSSAIDVSVLDVVKRRIIQPRMTGASPPALRHLCTAQVTLEKGSLLHSKVLEAVQAAQPGQPPASSSTQQQQLQPDAACSGHTLLVFGGLTPDDTEAGGQQLFVLWLAAGASWGVWLSLTTSGHAPTPRAYACCQAVSGGHTMIVYGGWTSGSLEGTINADVSAVDGYMVLCIYLLDVNSLAWVKQPTWPLNEPPKAGHALLGPSTCPGPRKQAMCCSRISPVTGNEEFVVLGGCGSDGLASFVPYVLDLATFIWIKGPVMGYLPASRDANTLMQLSREWLLLLGGKGPRGEPLTDVQRLHLPTLLWRPPLLISGGSAAAVRQPGSDTVDFTANAGVVVGGNREGPYGVVIMPRLEVLLPGPPIVFEEPATAAADAAADAAQGGFFDHQRQLQDSSSCSSSAQQLPQPGGCGPGGCSWMQVNSSSADTACRCGSCCGCLAIKAEAAATTGGCEQLVLGPCVTSPAFAPGTAACPAVESCCPPTHMQQQPRLPGLQCGAAVSNNQQPNADSVVRPLGAAQLRSSGQGCGSKALSEAGIKQQQHPHPLCEIEIEPDAIQPTTPVRGSLAAAGGTSTNRVWVQADASGKNTYLTSSLRPAAAAAAEGYAVVEEQQQWHAPQQCGLKGQPVLLQLLAAAGVLLLGLLLAYPSIMLQQAVGEPGR